MSAEYAKPRDTPVAAVVMQRWDPTTYKRTYEGQTFPRITHVPGTGDTPQHGTYVGPEGTVVVNVGDVITVGLGGDYHCYSFLEYKAEFEGI